MTKNEMNQIVSQVISAMKQTKVPMKKAKAKSRTKTTFKKRVPQNHLYIKINEKLASSLSKVNQNKYYALCGSIEQLMKSYNDLYDSAKHQSVHNKEIIKKALVVLEKEIDSKIDYSNSFEKKGK